MPNGEATGTADVVACVAAPNGVLDEDPNTDVEDCCGPAVDADAEDPNIDDAVGLKIEEVALEDPKGAETAGAAPKLLLAPNIDELWG